MGLKCDNVQSCVFPQWKDSGEECLTDFVIERQVLSQQLKWISRVGKEKKEKNEKLLIREESMISWGQNNALPQIWVI